MARIAAAARSAASARTTANFRSGLLLNGHFEGATGSASGSDQWIGNPGSGWWLRYYSGTGTASFDNSVYFGGSQSIKIAVSANGYVEVVSTRTVTATDNPTADGCFKANEVLPSTSYTVTAVAKGTGSNGGAFALNVNQFKSNYTPTASNSNYVFGTVAADNSTWTTYSKIFTSESDAAYVHFYFRSSNTTGTAWVDNFSFQQTNRSNVA